MTSNGNKVAQLQNQLIDLGYPVDDPCRHVRTVHDGPRRPASGTFSTTAG